LLESIRVKDDQSLLSGKREAAETAFKGEGRRWVMKIEMSGRTAPMEMITKTT